MYISFFFFFLINNFGKDDTIVRSRNLSIRDSFKVKLLITIDRDRDKDVSRVELLLTAIEGLNRPRGTSCRKKYMIYRKDTRATEQEK